MEEPNSELTSVLNGRTKLGINPANIKSLAPSYNAGHFLKSHNALALWDDMVFCKQDLKQLNLGNDSEMRNQSSVSVVIVGHPLLGLSLTSLTEPSL